MVLAGDHDGAAADEIAEQHAEQQRKARCLQHGARAVAVGDVADLVRDHAGELVRRLGFVDEPLEDIDVAARAGRRRWLRRGARRAALSGMGKAAAVSSWPMSLSNAARPGFSLRGISAFESGAGMAGVEAARVCRVDRGAELALDRVGDERGEAGGDRRHAEDRDEQQARRWRRGSRG